MIEHSWDLTPKEAIALQKRLRDRLETRDRLPVVETVAGVDVGFEDGGRVTRAAVVVLRVADLVPIAHAVGRRETRFPYVPGLLSFREIPAVLDAFARLVVRPDLVLCDGHGYAHPRRFGIACHLGLWLDLPTIGIGKSRLVGRHDDVPATRGGRVALVDNDEVIGAVVRSRERVKPIFVSVGHRVGLDTAVAWAMRCVTRYRLPETTRQADRLASHGGLLPPPKTV